MSFIAVAVAGAGIVGSVISGSQQAGAIKDASGQQAASTQQQLALQQQARQEAKTTLQPYSTEGASARTQLNALYGLGGGGGTPDWTEYQSRPEVAAGLGDFSTYDPSGDGTPWARSYAAAHPNDQPTNGWSEYMSRPEVRAGAYAAAHPGDQPNVTGAQTADQAQAGAMDQFRKSPYAGFAADATQTGTNAIFSTQGAAGRGSLSGKALRAAADWNQQQQGGAFDKYTTALGGIADTGYSADTGIASGGTAFANGAANTLAAGSNAQSQLTMQGGANTASTINNALGFLGWGAGQLTKPTNTLFSGARVGSPGAAGLGAGVSFYG